MRIRPLAVNSSCITAAANDREKECYRFYGTPIGMLTELELNYWRIGGREAVRDFMSSFDRLFTRDTTSLPVEEVRRHLMSAGIPAVVVEVNIGWLIKSNVISFDPVNMHIGRRL